MKVLLYLAFAVMLVSGTPTQNPSSSSHVPFPVEFFFEVVKEASVKNLIVSPTSVQLCLALAYLGAAGKTAEEFHNVLHFSGTTQQDIAKFYGDYFSYVQSQSTNDIDMSIGNRIYVDKRFSLQLTYNELVTRVLKAAAENVEFKDSATVASKINTWVEAQTHNKIKNIVSSESFDESTAVVLVNAIYFKAPWKYTFEKYATKKHDFHLSKSKTTQVDMMNAVETYEVADWADIGATGIRIPYANTDIYMLIILPSDIEGLSSVEEKLKAANHAHLRTTFKKQAVDFQLPKFKFEFDVSLVGVLKKLGLTTMFESADFSAMVEGNQPLKVSDVKHKAFIAVDEDGTEAAAATAVIAVATSSVFYSRPPRKITVDHPFMFVIRDEKAIFFAGHVVEF